MPRTIQPVLSTRDIDRARAFYTRVFAAVTTMRVPDEGPVFYLRLQIGDSELGLVTDDTASLDAPQRMLLSIDVDDVDQLLTEVGDGGGRILGPPNDMPWGQRVAHIQDPDGNTINLTETAGTNYR